MDDVAADIDTLFGGQVSGLQGKPTAIEVAVLRRKLAPVQPALLSIVQPKYRKQARSTGGPESCITRHTTDTHEAGIPRCRGQRPIGPYPSRRIGPEQSSDFYNRNHAGPGSCWRPRQTVRRRGDSAPTKIQSIAMSWHCGKIVAIRNCG